MQSDWLQRSQTHATPSLPRHTPLVKTCILHPSNPPKTPDRGGALHRPAGPGAQRVPQLFLGLVVARDLPALPLPGEGLVLGLPLHDL